MANVEYSGNPEATCYYDRLGISRSTDQDELTTVGKIAKREAHPDNSSAERKTAEMHFNRVNTAVNVLRDSEKREAYDAFISRFGTETGTEEYEKWVDADRPAPADRWESSNRTTNTSSQRQSDTQHTSTDTDRTTSDDETTTADSEKSTHDTSYGYHTPTSETRSSSQQDQTESATRQGSNTDSSTRNQNGTIYESRTEQEPYSRWRDLNATIYNSVTSNQTTQTQSEDSKTTVDDSATAEYTASYVPDPVDIVIRSMMSTPLGVIFSSNAPKSLSSRIYFVLLSYWILSFFPVSTAVMLVLWYCLFAPFPRIGFWLSGTAYAYIVSHYFIFQWYYPLILPEEAIYATLLAVGYYLLIKDSSLDPYASV